MPNDSTKVKTLMRLGQQYHNSLPDSASYFYKKSIELAKKINFPDGLVRCISNYCDILNSQGKLSESLQLTLESKALCEKYHLNNELLIGAIANIGTVYQYKEDYRTAAEYYLKALPLLENSNKIDWLSMTNGNLSGIYRTLKEPDKELFYAQQALLYAKKSNDKYALGLAYTNLGNALKDVKQIKGAIQYQKDAYEVGKQIDDIYIQTIALINEGDALIQDHANPDEYIGLFEKALPLADSLNYPIGKSTILYSIAYGHFMKKQYKRAENQAIDALNFSLKNDLKESEKNALLLLSDIQIALGNLYSSQQYRNKYDSIANILTNTELQKNVQELETRYQVEKKQTEILNQKLLLEQKNRQTLRQRNWLIASLTGVATLILLLLGIHRFYRQRQLLNAKAMIALKSEQENIRLKASL